MTFSAHYDDICKKVQWGSNFLAFQGIFIEFGIYRELSKCNKSIISFDLEMTLSDLEMTLKVKISVQAMFGSM